MTVGELIDILSKEDKNRTISVYDIYEKECYPIYEIISDPVEIDETTDGILEDDIIIKF